MSHLNNQYVNFVKDGGKVKEVIQEAIDRVQYSDGFLNQLQSLISQYDSPFETIIRSDMGTIRRLKPEYYQ
jgi:hypothetical protein